MANLNVTDNLTVNGTDVGSVLDALKIYLSANVGDFTSHATKLTSQAYNDGNITLSQPLTNFGCILVISTNDSSRGLRFTLIPAWQLRYAYANYSSSTFDLVHGTEYWTINVSSLFSTTLTTYSQNSIIKEIWGITL